MRVHSCRKSMVAFREFQDDFRAQRFDHFHDGFEFFPIAAPIFDLYKNPREDRPQDAIYYGVGFGGQFVAMLKRHLAMKQKYPDREPGRDLPYGGIENLRPETQALVEGFRMQKALMQP